MDYDNISKGEFKAWIQRLNRRMVPAGNPSQVDRRQNLSREIHLAKRAVDVANDGDTSDQAREVKSPSFFELWIGHRYFGNREIDFPFGKELDAPRALGVESIL